MKILIMHNRYAVSGRGSGEEVAITAISGLLRARGHEVQEHFRSSLELEHMCGGKFRAFFTGLYNLAEQRRVARVITSQRPQAVLAQNLYPFLSPSVLVACKRAGLPVLMRCPNYRLICPTGLLLSQGEICERCLGGHEYWCVLRNCAGDMGKSAGYAARFALARRLRLILDHVDIFLALTEFARQKFVENGVPAERVAVVGGLVSTLPPADSLVPGAGDYIGYIGRDGPEKGLPLLLAAAARLPEIPFTVAGPVSAAVRLMSSPNVRFVGPLDGEAVADFYRRARVVVVPSRCYEGLPNSALEAMSFAKPVIGARLGGMPEVIEENGQGLLFEKDNIEELAEQISRLWQSEQTRARLGASGRDKVERLYSPEAYYVRFSAALERALELARARALERTLQLAQARR